MSSPSPAMGAQPCYRHPDRTTYIRCTRCDRPICTDCMRSASVGFQCPECVGEAAATTRQPQTVSGANLSVSDDKPYVVYAVIAINLVVFGLQYLVGQDKLAEYYGMWPIGIVYYDEWYRLITSAFLHGGILHIAFNMYVLFALGPVLERVLGHVRFTVLYLVCAFGGSVASYTFSEPNTLSIGASGAIFGVMGALVVAGRRMRWDVTQVVTLLVINVVIGFISPGTDWRAHFGGLITGALVAAVFVWTPSVFAKSRLLWQVLGVLAVLAVLVGITVWRTGELVTLVTSVGLA